MNNCLVHTAMSNLSAGSMPPLGKGWWCCGNGFMMTIMVVWFHSI